MSKWRAMRERADAYLRRSWLGLGLGQLLAGVAIIMFLATALFVTAPLASRVDWWNRLSSRFLVGQDGHAEDLVSTLWILVSVAIGVIGLIPVNGKVASCIDYILPHHVHCSACDTLALCTHRRVTTERLNTLNRLLRFSLRTTALLIVFLCVIGAVAVFVWRRDDTLPIVATVSGLGFVLGVIVADGTATAAHAALADVRREVVRSQMKTSRSGDGAIALVEPADFEFLEERLASFGRLLVVLDLPIAISLVFVTIAERWSFPVLNASSYTQGFEIGVIMMHVVLATIVALLLERKRELPDAATASDNSGQPEKAQDPEIVAFGANAFFGLFSHDQDLAEQCEKCFASMNGDGATGLIAFEDLAAIDDRIWMVTDRDVQSAVFAFMDRFFSELPIVRLPTLDFVRERAGYYVPTPDQDGKFEIGTLLRAYYRVRTTEVSGGRLMVSGIKGAFVKYTPAGDPIMPTHLKQLLDKARAKLHASGPGSCWCEVLSRPRRTLLRAVTGDHPAVVV